jgi:hypothetical protein
MPSDRIDRTSIVNDDECGARVTVEVNVLIEHEVPCCHQSIVRLWKIIATAIDVWRLGIETTVHSVTVTHEARFIAHVLGSRLTFLWTP